MTKLTKIRFSFADGNEDLLASWQHAVRKQDTHEELDLEPNIVLFGIRLSNEELQRHEGLELLQVFKRRYPELT